MLTEALPVERKTISIMKACELVGVSRRTIYNWLSSGKVEYVRTAGGSVRIFVDTLWRDPHHSDRPPVDSMWHADGRNQA
jgi:excisionase family DNA binding protein